MQYFYFIGILVCGVSFSLCACADDTTDTNAVTSAEDAFGMTVGSESLGVYNSSNVRGFSPGSAGNFRIEGLYFDRQANLNNRIQAGSTIRVGVAAQGYAFPAPTGIIDVHLKESGNDLEVTPKITYGAQDTFGIELDGKFPMIEDRLSIAAGSSAFRNHFSNGGHADSASFGIVPRWKPNSQVEVIVFAGSSYSFNETNPGTYITNSEFNPPKITRGRYPGPAWTTTDSVGTNLGAVVKGAFGDWTLRFGRFYSIYDVQTAYSNLFNLSENGEVTRTIVAYPATKYTASSGEIRLSKLFEQGSIKHLFTASLRDRTVKNSYGGGDAHDYDVASMDSVFEPVAPNFQMGQLTQDTVKQITGALSYGIVWKDMGELTVGMQKTTYDKTVKNPNLTSERQKDDAWLPSISLSKPITKKFSLYTSYVKGIENAGVAPSYAVNSNQVLPVIQTKQWDAGFQWNLSDRTKLIVGYYDITKPYLAMSKSNYYQSLGEETHRGVEMSLTSNPINGLTLVAGAILSKPRVQNVTETNEVIGERPVAQSDYTVQFSFDYTLPWIENLSLDGGVNYQSSQAATVSNKITIPSYATIDLGVRYRFKVGNYPSTLRVQANNITNKYTYYVLGSGVYDPIEQRGVSASISTRF